MIFRDHFKALKDNFDSGFWQMGGESKLISLMGRDTVLIKYRGITGSCTEGRRKVEDRR
jgi:hypothetical protein